MKKIILPLSIHKIQKTEIERCTFQETNILYDWQLDILNKVYPEKWAIIAICRTKEEIIKKCDK